MTFYGLENIITKINELLGNIFKTYLKIFLFPQWHPKLFFNKNQPSSQKKQTYLYYIFYRISKFEISYCFQISWQSFIAQRLQNKQRRSSLSSHIRTISVASISVRAKSCLHDTITQTWYYYVCVILCKHGDIHSITSP